jgi:dolichol kinase
MDDRPKKLSVCRSFAPSCLNWLTDHTCRDAADDGILTGLLGGPLIVTALLYLTIQWSQLSADPPLPANWLIETPTVLLNEGSPETALDALLVSRRSLVSLSTFCSTILIVHVCASRITEARHRRKIKVPDGELSHVPRKEARRGYLYVLFAVSVTLWILCVKIALAEAKLGIWQGTCVAHGH